MMATSRAEDKELPVNHNMYMADADFDTISALIAERSDITMTVSSTPTGHRSRFYSICTNPKLGYSLHHHPSQHNPNFTEEMDQQFKQQLSAAGYQHEILAEFGQEEAGVFDKSHVDAAMTIDNYAYNELDKFQRERCVRNGTIPKMWLYSKEHQYRGNPFTCMGVDWDYTNVSLNSNVKAIIGRIAGNSIIKYRQSAAELC